MLEKFTDLSKLDTFPEEVQEVIRYHEELGRELMSIEHHADAEGDSRWRIGYYAPLIQGETSPFDEFFFATVLFYTWPEQGTHTMYDRLERCEMAAAMEFQSKRKPVEMWEVA